MRIPQKDDAERRERAGDHDGDGEIIHLPEPMIRPGRAVDAVVKGAPKKHVHQGKSVDGIRDDGSGLARRLRVFDEKKQSNR